MKTLFGTQTFSAVAMAAALVSGVARGGDLRPSFEWESTAVLPQGVKNPRLKMLFTSSQERFDDAGQTQALAARLTKAVSWRDLKASPGVDTQILEAKLIESGIDESASAGPGYTAGEVNVAARVLVPALAFGVTNRLTVAVALPIFSVDVAAQTGFSLSPDGQRFLAAVDRSAHSRADDLATKLNYAVAGKIEKLGYKPIQSEHFTRIGDVKAVAKYLALATNHHALAIKGELTAPSGKVADPDKLVDLPTGDGQPDLTGALIYELNVVEGLKANLYTSYTAQLSDRIVRRIPKAAGESLTDDKEQVERNLGDVFGTGVGVSYFFEPLGITVGSTYNFQTLGQTHYRGTTFAQERYRFLEREAPAQRLQSVSLLTGFSTVEWYRKGGFAVPMQANFSYNRPLSGRNTTVGDLYATELVLFF